MSFRVSSNRVSWASVSGGRLSSTRNRPRIRKKSRLPYVQSLSTHTPASTDSAPGCYRGSRRQMHYRPGESQIPRQTSPGAFRSGAHVDGTIRPGRGLVTKAPPSRRGTPSSAGEMGKPALRFRTRPGTRGSTPDRDDRPAHRGRRLATPRPRVNYGPAKWNVPRATFVRAAHEETMVRNSCSPRAMPWRFSSTRTVSRAPVAGDARPYFTLSRRTSSRGADSASRSSALLSFTMSFRTSSQFA